MKKQIYVRGPFLSQSGYGEQSRFALRALKSQEERFDIYLQPIPWGETGWVWADNEFRRWIDERIKMTQILIHKKQFKPDISLQITIPNEFEKVAPINIGYTAGIETTKVAPQWLAKGNEMDKLLVVSNHAKTTYVNTVAQAQNTQTGEIQPYKLTKPIEVVHEITPRHSPTPIEGFDPKTKFNFLMISQWGPRKNFENAIKWWVEEFIDQNVGLVLKTSIKSNCVMDFEYLEKRVESLLSGYKDRKCKVYLLHGDLTEGQMSWLYNHDKIKAMVNIAHGEGFGLPLFEAAREALPIVTIPWSGQMDFLHHDGENYFQEVDYSLRPIQQEARWDGVLEQDSMWAFADQGSYKMTLRKTHKKWKQAKKTAEKLQILLNEKFNEEKLYSQFCDAVHTQSAEERKWSESLSQVELI